MIALEARLCFSLALGLLLVGSLVSAGPKYVFWGVDPVGGPRQDHPEDFNQWADTVGYSLYWVDPASFSDFGDQLASHDNPKWAACEWYWGAPDAESWCRNFERTLGFADCQFLCIYPLDKSEFQPGACGWEGLKQLFETWGD